MNPNIFKSYDIRGIYPEELNEDDAFKIGQIFVVLTNAKKIIVGQDGRLSSPVLYNALVRGINSQGANVYNIGVTPTEGVYFASVKYGYDAGIMVTASHNPKEYNGFKMIKKRQGNIFEAVRGKDLLEFLKNNFSDKVAIGKTENLNIWPDYISHIFSFVNVNNINPFKVIVDAGNGVAGKIINLIKDRLPVKIIPLNFDIDGNFSSHPPNPLLPESSEQIKKKIVKEKADFGVIFDGDGDRVFLIDEVGELIRGDIGLLFLAKYLLKKYPNKAVVYNLICSKVVPEFIDKMGGIPIRSKVGSVNLREVLMKNNGIVSGEISGHYSFKDNFYFDSGIMAFLIFLEIISESNKKVSQMVKEFLIYEISAEINFEVKDKEKVLEEIKNKYSDGKQDFLDGVTVEYDNWWFNVRPSNTEPLLRLTVEADTKELLKQKKQELSCFINK